jgi:putative transposase
MDRGYTDYAWYNRLNFQGIFFVTRLRRNARYRVTERRGVRKSKGLTSDQTIELTGAKAGKCPIPLRRIGFKDAETGNHYYFLTNNFALAAGTIAEIYKARWQIELFFKWIKQNLKIKSFLGTSRNAVMTQIWIAICVYLLLAYLKFASQIGGSFQQILRLLHLNLFERRDLRALLVSVTHGNHRFCNFKQACGSHERLWESSGPSCIYVSSCEMGPRSGCKG